MPASSYICISHAAADRPLVERFAATLSGCGFRAVCIDEQTPVDERNICLNEGAMLLVLTSPAASESPTCEADFHFAMNTHRPVMCIRLLPGALEDRLTAGDGSMAERFIAYPAAETEHPDDRAMAMFVHRLFIRHLCRLSSCFDPSACTDPRSGRLIRRAVKAWDGARQARYVLGLAYDRGNGLPLMDTEAAYWMEKSAAGGYPEAMLYLGEMKLSGAGTEKDPAGALRLFAAVAQLNDPRGHFAHALCYLYGFGVMKDPEMALHHMLLAAKGNYAPAYYRLGLMYRDGVGLTKRSWRRAVACLHAACRVEGLGAPLYGRSPEGHTEGNRYHCVSMRHMRQIRLGDLLFGRHNRHWREHPKLVAKAKVCMAKCRARVVAYPENAWMDSLNAASDHSRYQPTHGYCRQAWHVAVAAETLGRMLELGSPADGISPSPRAALAWYRIAMRQGHSGAMYRLGEAYRSGKGVPADGKQAVRLFRRCADFGSEKGHFALGVCYERGIGIPCNLPSAVTQYEKAARAGYTPAQNNLGGCYEHGLGVARDMLAAVEWYSKAAAGGQPNAICRLGMCYEHGYGVTQSNERAFRLYERAAEQGHAYAMYRLAMCYDKGIHVDVHLSMAARLYERAAQGGVAEAAYAFGLCCQNGRGVRRDERAGFVWFSEAAARGHIRAAYEMGCRYFEGRAAVQSYARAAEAFRAAANYAEARRIGTNAEDEDDFLSLNGGLTVRHAAGDAMYMLGYCTLYGLGVTAAHPTEEAMAWFRRAAALEHGKAMTALGDLYTYGLIEDGEAAEAATRAYEGAARLGQTDAMLTLAEGHRRRALALTKSGDTQEATRAYTAGRALLLACAEEGNVFALQALAAYALFGWGCAKDPVAAHDFLRRSTESRDGTARRGHLPIAGSVGGTAYLWLGDFSYTGWNGTPDPVAADTAYRYATAVNTQAACPGNILRCRHETRMTYARRVQAEAYYRLAILRAVGVEDDRHVRREEAFTYLSAAIVAGHGRALDDLARMYAYEKSCADDAEAALRAVGKKKKKQEKEAPAETFGRRNDHLAWMTAYYAARRPTLRPFGYEPRATPREDAQPYVTCEVTPTMRACALNHLGDCLFEGKDIYEDRAAAVACYRQAAETTQGRGEPVAGGIIWAKYSLGWCLLNGEGVAKDPREGVRFLMQASRYHAEAAYTLGVCYETGIGVEGRDVREAVKYYRKAVALRHEAAVDKLKLLERQLR